VTQRKRIENLGLDVMIVPTEIEPVQHLTWYGYSYLSARMFDGSLQNIRTTKVKVLKAY
jgi:hypothetical protein